MDSLDGDRTDTPEVDILGRRLLAFVVDCLVLMFAAAIAGPSLTPLHLGLGIEDASAPQFLIVNIGRPSPPDWPVMIPLSIGYFILFEAIFGATIGKALLGLKVVDRHGNRAGLVAVVVRNLTRPIEALNQAFWLGAIVILCSRRRQRLGDHLARTVVADAHSVPNARLSGAACRRGVGILIESAGLLALALGVRAYTGYGALQVDQGWSTGNSGTLNTSGHLAMPPDAVRVSSYNLSAPHREGDYLVYALRYSVLAGQAPDGSGVQPVTCTGTIRLSWSSSWLEGWVPHDMSARCPGVGQLSITLWR